MSDKNLNTPVNIPALTPTHAVAKEPPAEILAQEFTMDVPLAGASDQKIVPPDDAIIIKDKTPDPVAAAKAKTTDTKVEPKPVEKVDKIEDKVAPVEVKSKVEPKVEDTTRPKEKKPLGVPEVKGNTSDTFDYAGFSPEETNNLKNMSRGARDWAGRIAKENKDLSKLKDSTYLQHPNAYILNPEFQDLHMQTGLANKEAFVWSEQLENIKLGKEWTPITGWNANGSPIYGAARPATNRDEEQVRLWMNQCLSVAETNRGKIAAYPEKFKHQVGADLNTINETRKAMFGWVADPKMLDQTIDDPEGKGAVKISAYRDELKSFFPLYLQSSPLMEAFADTYAAMKIQARMIINAEAGSKLEEKKEEEVGLVEPSSRLKPAKQEEGVNGSPAMFDLEGLPR